MPLRPPAGYIRPGYDPLQVPNAPTGVSASAGDTQATVSFTAPTNVGGSAITGYGASAVKTSDGTTVTNTGASSPITVTGLTNGSAYTMNVWALNTYGPSPFGTSGSVTPAIPPDALFAGGQNTSTTINVISYINIATTGNSKDFGDLTVARYGLAGCSSTTRGVFGGGVTSNVIDYVTIASTGDATDFGDLTVARGDFAGLGSATRGVFGGGGSGAGRSNVIDYITIASAGNATDFGDIAVATTELAGCSSTTRGLFGGGNGTSPFYTNTIEYITIASAGNATDFGDLTQARNYLAACSSSTRGIFGGGSLNDLGGTSLNTIDYVTIASTGNATDFGDLITASQYFAATSNSTRGVFGGGALTGGTRDNTIQYITIASTGNSTDFGDLITIEIAGAACSNAHGGL